MIKVRAIEKSNELRLRPVKQGRLSKFQGVLPATLPYPGKAAIRQQVAEKLAQDWASG